MMDIGLMRSLSGFDGPVTGELFETYVICEIAKYIRTLGLKVEMSFYRTHSGMEVDLILETPRGILALEIKNRDSYQKKDYRNLVKLREAHKDQWLAGCLIYRGDQIKQISETIWAIPSWRLLMNG
jgi:predicted AAA+ superfamily ATPase